MAAAGIPANWLRFVARRRLFGYFILPNADAARFRRRR
jgi:hypothetical protein